MPAPTFTPGNNKQDEQLNPGARDYQRTFEDIARNEEAGTFDDIANNYDKTADPSQEDANIQKIKDDEANGDTPGDWTNNTTSKSKQLVKGKSWIRKASPFLGIGGGLGIGGLLFTALLSPSILIVQIKETMVDKFNTQLSAMEMRSNKLLNSKISGATSGFCSNTVSIRCKFSSMSEKQIKKFADAGIEVKGESTTAVRNRLKPTEFVWNGRSITASEFTSLANTDTSFRSAVRQAYNPKYAGFVGKAWGAVAAKFKISKKLPELNAANDKEKARARISEIAKEGMEEDTGARRVTAVEGECEGSRCYNQEDANKVNSGVEAIEEGGANKSAAADVRAKLAGLNSAGAVSFFKVTGIVDYTCQAYGAINALSYAGKVIRAAQLVRYFMIFSVVADAIKAGESPDPADVALLGDIATTTVRDTTDPTKNTMGSLTDSFGYKYAAYGDSSASEQSMNIANRFISGGGFIGELSATTGAIVASLGGRQTANTTCSTLANPFVQGGSLVLGIASLLVPGVNVGRAVTSIGVGAAISVGIAMLPSLLADTLAGTVTDGISGEEAGNAMASGAGALLSDSLAAQNGGAPMSKDDAIAYNTYNSDVSERYIADELEGTNPFDATNPNTFVGKLASSLVPITSSSNPLTAVGSLLSNSLKSLTPTTKAASQEQYAKSLDVCQDLDVLDAGYAADPFCNTIRGIPQRYLERDSIDVVNDLISRGEISESGEPQGSYKDFIAKCITNETPIGYSDLQSGYNNDEAKSCIISDSNANYYLNYMDRRIDLGMDGEDVEGSSGAENPATTGRPENVRDAGKGWALNYGSDYSATACDPRTEDIGIFTKDNGTKLRICKINTDKYPAWADNSEAGIASIVSTNVMNMFEAASTAGIQLGISSGFRATGATQHGYGLAMDLGSPRGGQTLCFDSGAPNGSQAGWNSCSNGSSAHAKAFQWLRENGPTYGFYAMEGTPYYEPWHWSTSGF